MYNTTPVSLDVAMNLALAYMRSGIIPLLISPPGTGKTTTAVTLGAGLVEALFPRAPGRQPSRLVPVA